ncbi:MAG: GTP 3',8-cyclase MoaA [Thermoanaerobaculia bacterium]
MSVEDRLGRGLRDLRISVTDRCNFRCSYCMPRERFGADHRFLARAAILTYEEIERLARIFHHLGVRKIRLTGGEPLLRRDLPDLVRRLSGLPGVDLALTTNGALLGEAAADLAAAGLGRLTLSLDSLDDATFRRMNDAAVPVARVLDGLAAARAAGFPPAKINAVAVRGVNEDSIVELARHFRGTGHTVRFIEFMDVGTTNGWRLDRVVPAREILARLEREFALEAVDPAYRGEVARRYRYLDGAGEIGIISSVTQPFCGDCTRARLSADGRLFTCLFAATGTDLKAPLRAGEDDAALAKRIADVWLGREDRYSELRAAATADQPRIEMSYIGG